MNLESLQNTFGELIKFWMVSNIKQRRREMLIAFIYSSMRTETSMINSSSDLTVISLMSKFS